MRIYFLFQRLIRLPPLHFWSSLLLLLYLNFLFGRLLTPLSMRRNFLLIFGWFRLLRLMSPLPILVTMILIVTRSPTLLFRASLFHRITLCSSLSFGWFRFSCTLCFHLDYRFFDRLFHDFLNFHINDYISLCISIWLILFMAFLRGWKRTFPGCDVFLGIVIIWPSASRINKLNPSFWK